MGNSISGDNATDQPFMWKYMALPRQSADISWQCTMTIIERGNDSRTPELNFYMYTSHWEESFFFEKNSSHLYLNFDFLLTSSALLFNDYDVSSFSLSINICISSIESKTLRVLGLLISQNLIQCSYVTMLLYTKVNILWWNIILWPKHLINITTSVLLILGAFIRVCKYPDDETCEKVIEMTLTALHVY